MATLKQQDELEKFLETLNWFDVIENRARELSSDIPKAKLFVGIQGIEMPIKHFDMSDACPFISCIRSVTNPPGVVHVSLAADLRKTDYLGVSRYSSAIVAEVALGDERITDPSLLLKLAWHSMALLKLRGHARLTCPVASSVSWDTVCGLSDHSVHFHLLDDVPKYFAFLPKPSPVSIQDVEWVKANCRTALRLRDQTNSRRFGLAYNLAYIWNHTTDLRIAVANLWFGLEALFGDTHQPVKANLARRISAWLPAISESEIRDLYKNRCEAVHGRWLDDGRILKAIEATEPLLRNALIKCIATGTTPLTRLEVIEQVSGARVRSVAGSWMLRSYAPPRCLHGTPAFGVRKTGCTL